MRRLVGEDRQSLVTDLGAAFARLMRTEDARPVVIGHDMRDNSPSLARRSRAGVTEPRRGASWFGVHRSALFRLGLLDCPGDVHTSPPGGIQRHQDVSGRRQIGADTGLTAIP